MKPLLLMILYIFYNKMSISVHVYHELVDGFVIADFNR